MESTVNIPLLRKAVEWAEAEAAKPPELCEWDQGAYRWVNPWMYGMKSRECGTCYCIAGYVTSLVNEDFANGGAVPDPAEIAADALGIERFNGTADAGAHLFSDDNSIEDVRRIAEQIAGESL